MFSLQDMMQVFLQLNKDAADNGESVVPFTDVEYYTNQICNLYQTPIVAGQMMAKWMADNAPVTAFSMAPSMREVEQFEMIATFKPTGQQVKTIITVETSDVCDQDDTFGEIQGNFLWENFDFNFKELGRKQQLAILPVNVYSDVTVIKGE